MTFLAACIYASLAASPSGTSLSIAKSPPLLCRAYWSPIDNSAYNVHKQEAYRKQFDFKPAQPTRMLKKEDLNVFLPPNPVKVGDIWKLNDVGLVNLLKQFHANPTTELHHMTGAGGGFASLTALSARYAEISFRFHAEFELEPKKIWFTPSQFTGHVLVDRKTQSVRSFRLAVPKQDPNYDMNVPTAADIGFIPRMELVAGAPYARKAHSWAASIPPERTAKEFAKKFYRFEEIDWLPLKTALAVSKQRAKALHVVILFGALENESC